MKARDIITRGFERIQHIETDDMIMCVKELMEEMHELFVFADDAHITLLKSYQYSIKEIFMLEYKKALVK
jgi:hypothetical protein